MEDAFGAILLGALEGLGEGHEIVERDDGYVKAAQMEYFAPVRRCPSVERRALRYVEGRVLDLGSGAGRVALEVQARGHEVVAVDPSPGAVAVSGRRGVHDVRQMRLEDVDASLGYFGTVLMYGNNFGLFGARMKARRLLTVLRPLADRVVAASNDPSATDDPAHLAYGKRNRRRHRMAGQARLRIRYHDLAGPWFDYLLVSPAEMEQLVDGTGWRIDRLVRDDGSYYVAVLV